MKIALLSRKTDQTFVRVSIYDSAIDTFRKCIATDVNFELVDIGSSEEMDEMGLLWLDRFNPLEAI